MRNPQNLPYRKLLTQNNMHQNDSKYFKFSTVGKQGEVSRRRYFMLLPIYKLVVSFDQSRFKAGYKVLKSTLLKIRIF